MPDQETATAAELQARWDAAAAALLDKLAAFAATLSAEEQALLGALLPAALPSDADEVTGYLLHPFAGLAPVNNPLQQVIGQIGSLQAQEDAVKGNASAAGPYSALARTLSSYQDGLNSVKLFS
jgi:hypothetical protein